MVGYNSTSPTLHFNDQPYTGCMKRTYESAILGFRIVEEEPSPPYKNRHDRRKEEKLKRCPHVPSRNHPPKRAVERKSRRSYQLHTNRIEKRIPIENASW
jgi:hypothetical protein